MYAHLFSFSLSFCIAIIFIFSRKSVLIGSVPACLKAGQSNIVLNRIFANAKMSALKTVLGIFFSKFYIFQIFFGIREIVSNNIEFIIFIAFHLF